MRQTVSLVPLDLTSVDIPTEDLSLVTALSNCSHPKWLLREGKGGMVAPEIRAKYLHRLMTIHWLVKLEWGGKKYKIPAPHGTIKTYKPLGELYLSVFNLCRRLHEESGSGFSTPSEWFIAIFSETAIESPIGALGNVGKSVAKKELQKQNAKMRAAETINPFHRETEPHTHRLIETAASLANRNEYFRQKGGLWQKFLAARSAWVRALDSPSWHGWIEEDGQHYVTMGQGRHREEIPHLPLHA